MLPAGAGFVPLCTEQELRTGKCPQKNNKNSHEVKATVHFPVLSEVGTGPGLAVCSLRHI